MDEQGTYAEREARELGAEHGHAAATWILDGNSTDADARCVLDGFADPGSGFEAPYPFSGQWADGLTLGWLSDSLGVDEESDGFPDLVSAFEDAYFEAYEREATRAARVQLGIDS